MLGAVRALAISLAIALLGCGSAPRARVATAVERRDLDAALEASDRFRAVEGEDTDLLGSIAGLILEREASGDPEVSRAAIQQLALAGTAGAPILVRLSRAPGSGSTRLSALEALARHGDEEARLALRALADSDDPEVLAASVAGMDPALDQPLLLTLARSPHASVRRAALSMLAPRATEDSVRALLVEIARVDAEASCRAAAVRALGRAGEGASEALRERLGDPTGSVRLAAVAALAQADAEAGRVALAPFLEIAPSPEGIEAARFLIRRADDPDGADDAARAFLERALASSDSALRAQAGVAIASLPMSAEPPLDALRAALERERDDDVRLSLARALWPRDRDAASATLRRLIGSGQGMPRVQAAVLLAAEGDASAREALARVIESDGESILRRTAARALARDALAPGMVRGLLRDEDPLVRVYAAGGILAAAAAT